MTALDSAPEGVFASLADIDVVHILTHTVRGRRDDQRTLDLRPDLFRLTSANRAFALLLAQGVVDTLNREIIF